MPSSRPPRLVAGGLLRVITAMTPRRIVGHRAHRSPAPVLQGDCRCQRDDYRQAGRLIRRPVFVSLAHDRRVNRRHRVMRCKTRAKFVLSGRAGIFHPAHVPNGTGPGRKLPAVGMNRRTHHGQMLMGRISPTGSDLTHWKARRRGPGGIDGR